MPDRETSPRRIDIRKYPNRRYYDTTRSQHITLEDICALIQAGHDVRVTDSKTGADITQKVLAQIILELDDEKIDFFPVGLLQRLIQANDQLIKDFIDCYFNQAFSAFVQYRPQFEEQLRQTREMSPFLAPWTSWSRAMFTPFGFPFGPGGGALGGNPAGSGANTTEAEALRQQVTALRQELQAVRSELNKAKAGKGGRKNRGKGGGTA